MHPAMRKAVGASMASPMGPASQDPVLVARFMIAIDAVNCVAAIAGEATRIKMEKNDTVVAARQIVSAATRPKTTSVRSHDRDASPKAIHVMPSTALETTAVRRGPTQPARNPAATEAARPRSANRW